MKKTYLFILGFIVSASVMAQNASMHWQKCLGGSRADSARSVARTADGGFIVAGVTYSNDNNVTGNHNPNGDFSDAWVVKIDKNGSLVWQKTLGGTSFDEASSVCVTSDGSVIVAGWTASNDGDVTGLHGTAGAAADFWLLKLDASGTLAWQKTYGGTKGDYATSVKQTADGGFVLAGYTYSNDGDVSGNHDNTGATSDFWVVKTDASGTLQWQKTYGGTGQDEAWSVVQNTDGSYVAAGVTYSNDGNVTRTFGPTTTDANYWLVKFDGTGSFTWQSCLGGSNADQAYSVVQVSDGSYVMAGYTNSNNDNVSGNHGGSGNTADEWIVDASASGGSMNWQHCFGGSLADIGRSIKQTSTGHLVVTGVVNSYNGDITGGHDLTGTTQDLWTCELNSNGYLLSQWENSLGGTGNDGGYDVAEAADSNFVEVGYTTSNDGNVSGNHGASDFWIVKVHSQNGAPNPLGIDNISANENDLLLYPNPTKDYTHVTVNDNLLGSWLDVYDAVGRTISHQQISNSKFRIETGGLAKGIYLVRVSENGNGGLVKKLVIE